MRYVLAVKSPSYGKQGSFLAYQFAKTLLAKGHQLTQVFFFQDGSYNGNAFTYPANDEFNLLKHWQQLSKDFSIPLHLCIAASQRRGIVDSSTSFIPNQNNLAEGFVFAGLGEFMKSILEADRVITL
ncbi:tRNA 2-thiouridine synthesizing protein D [Bisgaardia hudsonensis]|uniref:tRNA 2-thiouridine synthesizing protein D n=1 Tax=Bisgaardia hudsonensis TaxID=109472 RepID=A0A4R2MUG1_9PAST|nr:sulfurtransferase complex subunit TusD [Bisgaardia hudsonensis]QLB12142.1 tRNA 2-thiouridine(34) synthase TusD [Bisgaardia hudsonensis]TCP11501.1 tRNA 2-thiouridine synthesizing protein D [Bisgaardia hudsonensis]